MCSGDCPAGKLRTSAVGRRGDVDEVKYFVRSGVIALYYCIGDYRICICDTNGLWSWGVECMSLQTSV